MATALRLLLLAVSDDWALAGFGGLVGVVVVVVGVEEGREGREGLCRCHAGGTILSPSIRPSGE